MTSGTELKNKLTEEQVHQARNRYATEKCSYKTLAEEYGVTKYEIKKVLKGVTKWKLSVEERFWAKVNNRENSDECWGWLGTKDRYGYGRFWVEGKKEKAHRIAYKCTYGSIPEGMIIRHKVCGNRTCCNPNHLKTGTIKDNQLDMVEDGTHLRKLSYERILEAKCFQDIGWNEAEIAGYVGVTPKTIKKHLCESKNIETIQIYSNRAKRIADKEAKKYPPLNLIIDREIL